jgi:hypothetical protein
MATERVTKEDLIALGKLANEYGRNVAAYASALERAHFQEVAPSRLRVLESAESHAWSVYQNMHTDLVKRLEGEEFDRVVAPIERPTIYTLEDLEALPDDTVVMDDDSDFHPAYQKGQGRWYGDGRSYESGQIPLPVTVIFTPEGA